MGQNFEATGHRARYLVVSRGEKTLRTKAQEMGQKLLNKALHNVEPLAQTEDPQAIAIQRNHYFGIKRLRPGFGRTNSEAVKVAHVLEALSGGSKIKYRDFKVTDVKVNKDGEVKSEKELNRRRQIWLLRRGWQKGNLLTGSVEKAHNTNVRIAKQDLRRATHAGLKGFVFGEREMVKALAEDRKDQRRINKAIGREKIWKIIPKMRWYGWRAGLVAKFSERNPHRVGKNSFQVGKTPDQLFNEAYAFITRFMDNKPDPGQKIGGPFEKWLTKIDEFQQSPAGVFAATVWGDKKLYDTATDAINWTTNINKAGSRDYLRHPLYSARNTGVLLLYQKRYERMEGKGWTALRFPLVIFGIPIAPVPKWAMRVFGPPPPLVIEKAADRRMERGDVAREAKLRSILNATDIRDPMAAQHQKVVAEQYVRAYEANAPRLDVFIDTLTDTITGKGNSAKDAMLRFAPKFVKKLFDSEESMTQAQKDARAIIHEANEAYGADPKPAKEQVEAILAYADRVLAAPLTKLERVRWEIAKKSAEKLKANYDQAMVIKARTQAQA